MNIRQIIFYSGRVQGVGFRATTCSAARGFAVTGTVRNLPDGRVEVVVEGDVDEVADFRRELASRMAGFIRDSQTLDASHTGELEDFRVIR
ncbi:MAG: acylphosphatase [Planctomycetota bacterium]